MAGTTASQEGSARQPVGLIGTGLFGTALADRFLANGFPVRVYNRTWEKADPLLAQGAEWSDNPLQECQRIIFCVYTTGGSRTTTFVHWAVAFVVSLLAMAGTSSAANLVNDRE